MCLGVCMCLGVGGCIGAPNTLPLQREKCDERSGPRKDISHVSVHGWNSVVCTLT